MTGPFEPPAGSAPEADPPAALPGGAAPDPVGPSDEGLRRVRPRKKRPLFLSVLLYGGLLMVSIVLGALFFNLVVMPAFVRTGDEVRVPDLTGKDLTVAEAQLGPRGLQLGEANRRNDARPAGTIVAQHPAPNVSVKRGRLVSVVVSLGEAGVAVPSLRGETIQNARLALEQAGLTPGDVITAPCDTVAFNTIIATRPAQNQEASLGTPVDLLVSAGTGRSSLLMPDLFGRDADDVMQVLITAGFPVTLRGRAGAHERIATTEPPAGARVRYGEAIELAAD